jgi:hypothetical protein
VTKTPTQHADTAAEAIRALNHATQLAKGGLTYPGDAYSTLANLKSLAHQLPQAFQQINDFITRLESDGHLRSDRGRDSAEEVAAVTAGLTMAIQDAETLAEHLDDVHSALAPLAYQ